MTPRILTFPPGTFCIQPMFCKHCLVYPIRATWPTKSFLGLAYVVGLWLAIRLRVQDPADRLSWFGVAIGFQRPFVANAGTILPRPYWPRLLIEQLIYNCNTRQWKVTANVRGWRSTVTVRCPTSLRPALFFISSGGVRLNPVGTSATNWSIVPALDHRWVWSISCNKNWQGKRKYSEKTCPSVSTTNLRWNPDRRGGKPATNHLFCTLLEGYQVVRRLVIRLFYNTGAMKGHINGWGTRGKREITITSNLTVQSWD
jgi:hypothetical protein